jgi:hypothetical protein
MILYPEVHFASELNGIAHMLVVLLGHCVKPQRKMYALGSPCVVKGHRCLGRNQTRESGNVVVKRLGCVCFARPRTPPETAGIAGVIADTRDRPPEVITKMFRFLYKPASGWTDRFGVAWPLGEPDAVRLSGHHCLRDMKTGNFGFILN